MPERTIHQESMGPPTGSFIPEPRQQKSSKEIRCAEIKTIPSMKTGDQMPERGPRTFKIGEYNRATASFEIPSVGSTPIAELGMGSSAKPADFDLSADLEVSDHYFQSSFARSLASSQTKSLEYGVNKCGGAGGGGLLSIRVVPGSGRSGEMLEEAPKVVTLNVEGRCWQMPGQENWDLRRAEAAEITDEEMMAISINGKSIKKSSLAERCGSRSSSAFSRTPSECRDRLSSASPQSPSCRSSQHRSYSSASDMTAVMLQSQVTTLQWQLRQAEASRQMHRAVLEQVVGFLQRTHNDLNLLQSSMPDSGGTLNRVPRSRSVHSVEASLNGSCTIPYSESPGSFHHKTRSVTQITDPINCPKHGDAAYRDMTWRRPRRQLSEAEVSSPAKLSEEAFRLLRTVQSLLNTREPDLTSRLHSGSSSPVHVAADASSVSSTLDSDTPSSDTNFQSQDTVVHVGVKGQDELQAAFGGNCSPIPGLQAAHLKDATMSLGRRRRRRTVNGSPPQLSTSSADDESGFSSLNSFQDVAATSRVSSTTCQESASHLREHCHVIHEEKRGSYQEVGIPLRSEENCKIHRRWSSTPADKLRSGSMSSAIRVLWV